MNTIDAMKQARSLLHWHFFGDCRFDADPLPTPAHVDHLLSEAIKREEAQDEWHRGRAAGIEECEKLNAELKKRVNE